MTPRAGRIAAAETVPTGAVSAVPDAEPGATVLAFSRALVDGKPDVAATWFSPLGCLLTPDGTEVGGRASIAQLLRQLVTSERRLEIRTGRIVRADSVALCKQFWTRSSQVEGGEAWESRSVAHLVLQRSDEGWRILLALPWG